MITAQTLVGAVSHKVTAQINLTMVVHCILITCIWLPRALTATKGSYGGHPNPTRGNKNNKFNSSNPQSPIEGAAITSDCTYKKPVVADGALAQIASSSNGLTEYTSTNFLGEMQGNLLVAAFNKSIYRIVLNAAGTAVTSQTKLFTGVGSTPLDVTAQGSSEIFPGTIWVADNIGTKITIFEPSDY